MEGKDLRDVPNVKILEHYGAYDPPEGPGWKSMLCPFHEERRPSARSNGYGFVCNGCGVRGNAISLVMEREGIDYYAAIEFAEEITGEKYKSLPKNVNGRRRPFDDQLSETKRDYERHSGLFSLGSSKRSVPRIRPRLSGR